MHKRPTGVTVTIRNLTLARALVFTVGYGNMQPSLLHMRPGSRLVLQNVVVRTLCSTVRFYYAALDESVREALEVGPGAAWVVVGGVGKGGGRVWLEVAWIAWLAREGEPGEHGARGFIARAGGCDAR